MKGEIMEPDDPAHGAQPAENESSYQIASRVLRLVTDDLGRESASADADETTPSRVCLTPSPSTLSPGPAGDRDISCAVTRNYVHQTFKTPHVSIFKECFPCTLLQCLM